MSRHSRAVRIAAVAALALGAAAPAEASVQQRLATTAASAPASRVTAIVQFDPATTEGRRTALVTAAGGRVTRRLPIIQGAGVAISARGAAALGHQPGVRHVSLDSRVHAASKAPVPTTDAPATSFLSSTQVPSLWRVGGAGAGVGIAVIDTGIAGDLADFRRTRRGPSRVVASVVTDDRATTATDRYGHGTHVAGIAAGNGVVRDVDDPLRGRYSGAAPQADLVSVKASADDGSSTLMDVIAGLQFVVDHPELRVRVVNLSASASEPESYRVDPLDAAVESVWLHGVVVVAAAGNRGSDPDAVGYAPGNDPYVISVGAVDDKGTDRTGDDAVATWSSRGTTQDGFKKPDILAPGSHIVAPLAPDSAFKALCPTCVRGDGQYFQVSGTSMAAPVVAGIIADILSLRPGLTPNQVKAAIVAGARPTADAGREISAPGALLFALWGRQPAANRGLTPNRLIDPATGGIDFDKISWGKISWGRAADALVAPWAKISWGKISWGCATCDEPAGDATDTKISWGKISWGKISWGKISWGAFLGSDPDAELSGGSASDAAAAPGAQAPPAGDAPAAPVAPPAPDKPAGSGASGGQGGDEGAATEPVAPSGDAGSPTP